MRPRRHPPTVLLLQIATVSISTLDFTTRRILKATPVVSPELRGELHRSRTCERVVRTRSSLTWGPMEVGTFVISTERRCAPVKVPVSRATNRDTETFADRRRHRHLTPRALPQSTSNCPPTVVPLKELIKEVETRPTNQRGSSILRYSPVPTLRPYPSR